MHMKRPSNMRWISNALAVMGAFTVGAFILLRENVLMGMMGLDADLTMVSCGGEGERNGRCDNVERKPKRAFFSFLERSGDVYFNCTVALGYSIRNNSGYFTSKHAPDMVLMTLTDFKDDPLSRAKLEKVGWTIRPVNALQAFKEGYYDMYKNQYTKLLMWNMTEWDTVFYIDSDAVVRGSLRGVFESAECDELWRVQAVRETFGGRFNAGVMVLRPNAVTFQDMLLKGPNMDYDPRLSEQAFLNAYFGKNYAQLPPIYNLCWYLKDMLGFTSEEWRSLDENSRIIHYAGMRKPCELEKPGCDLWHRTFDEALSTL